eukprot:GHRQ01019600.1.p1 GENE.GHRQ01019600.1~~GHRQ01019600.1.p1  ORF type:complete len:190 (+),score=44.06 GHRQ01019600.1:163-732(+)
MLTRRVWRWLQTACAGLVLELRDKVARAYNCQLCLLQVFFYSHGAQGPVGLVSRRSYLGGVQAVHLNATHAAVLTDGRLLLHTIAARQQQQQLDNEASVDGEADLCLPKAGSHHHDPISCAALSQHFVVTGNASGSLCYHMLQNGELAVVNEHRHSGELQPCVCCRPNSWSPLRRLYACNGCKSCPCAQ